MFELVGIIILPLMFIIGIFCSIRIRREMEFVEELERQTVAKNSQENCGMRGTESGRLYGRMKKIFGVAAHAHNKE